MLMGREWTGFEAETLQRVTRQSIREFARRLGIDPKTVTTWRARGQSIQVRPLTARLLDITLDRSTPDQRGEFYRIIATRPPSLTMDSPAQLRAGTRPAGECSCLPTRSDTDDHVIYTPPGRYFAGTSTPAIVAPARMASGRVVADTSRLPSPAQARRLLIAATETSNGPRYFGLDPRRARSRSAASNLTTPVLIPTAYELNEFTTAILWAITNFDEALLDDYAELVAAGQHLDVLDTTPRPLGIGRRDSDLSAVSRMWPGSNYCAHHILRHLDQLTETPARWTREHRGEEASTWLLFTHKYEYLSRTAIFTGSSRVFCIPHASVAASPAPERILMLLAVALIESAGITVIVCAEPEYTTMEGFVLDPGHRAIVATWANTEHTRAEVTDHRPTLREYSDAAGWARTHSLHRRCSRSSASAACSRRLLGPGLGMGHSTSRRHRRLRDRGAAHTAIPTALPYRARPSLPISGRPAPPRSLG
ncbi:hypothetical protein [Nocardia sp. XZ_19_369]|uniref:hypothetical protein n=1 Tax=Nocardia sp. XZ_19_369 TaxID=2769487 RepID=UPI00188F2E5A|nr:hypothetical protein [Nocardia sp. XZ_19_369]